MMAFFRLAFAQRFELLQATAAHLDLVLEALLIAVLIGVPLGIVATRSRLLERLTIGAANVLQTVPSLALLGFLLILFQRIGKGPALAALVVYALLPIIKNTVLGLRGIDRGVAEAALGLGMTRWQRLTIVELPLAVPILLGGVRVAAVASVGMATIAAAIGAKGLGNYIFRGVYGLDTPQILLGAIPAAMLALLCDAALGEVEHALDPRRPRRGRIREIAAILAVSALIGGAAWGAWLDLPRRGEAAIVVGAKDSSESILLGHMIADLVESRTRLPVDRRFNLGGVVCYEGLKNGGVDVYIEYTGTALATLLKQPPDTDPARVLSTVRTLTDRDGVRCLDSLGFENTFAILMRRDLADRLKIRTISDLRRHVSTLRPGFGYEFVTRRDGYPGLVAAYDLHFAQPVREMDRGLLYDALARDLVDVAAGDSTDGRIAALDLVQLIDDRHYFPPYEAVPLARAGTLKRLPQLEPIFNALAGKIDAETMRKLNYQVDKERRDPAAVAREFLKARGLLKY